VYLKDLKLYQRNSETVRLSLIPTLSHMWVSLLLVLGLLRGSFSVYSGFPLFTKTNISKVQLTQDRGPALKPAKA